MSTVSRRRLSSLPAVRRPSLRRSTSPRSSVDGNGDVPPPSTWDEFADGRMRRLKRGKHFIGNAAIVAHEAELAAEALGKQALTYHDRLGKFEYLWVQFLDSKLTPDTPCPRCGGTELVAVQEYFLRCTTCGALHKLLDKRPTTTAATLERPRLLSLDGTQIEEMRVFDQAIVEAVCEFSRAVAVAHVSFVFYTGRRKALHAGCPELIVVPAADRVKISFNLDARMLGAGKYFVLPMVELVLDETDRRFHKIRARDALRMYVRDPADSAEEAAPDEHSRLQWSAVSALDGRPMPVFDVDGMVEDDVPAPEEDPDR